MNLHFLWSLRERERERDNSSNFINISKFILPAAGYTLPYSEDIKQTDAIYASICSVSDDIKYSCKKINAKFLSSSSGKALLRQLQGSLVATSIRTLTTIVFLWKSNRIRPVQRQFSFKRKAEMRTGILPIQANPSLISSWSRLTGSPLIIAAGEPGDLYVSI